jgi:hypothetical protein
LEEAVDCPYQLRPIGKNIEVHIFEKIRLTQHNTNDTRAVA